MKHWLTIPLLALLLCFATGCAAAPAAPQRDATEELPAATATPTDAAAAPKGEIVPLTQSDILANTRRLLHDNKPGFTQEELDLIEFLDLNDTGITDVSDLRYFPNLTDLSLRESRLPDLSGLSGAPALIALDLTDSRQADLTAMPPLEHLETLILDGNPVADLTPLAALPALETLSLRQKVCTVERIGVLVENKRLTALTFTLGSALQDPAQMGTLSHLASLTVDSDGTAGFQSTWITGLADLETLELTCERGTDLSKLHTLPSLTSLTVRGHIADVRPLAHCARLKTLSLYKADVTRVAPLTALTGLEELTLLGLHVQDVRELAAMTWLQKLTVDNISDEDEMYLREQMPKTRIRTAAPAEE